MGLAGRGPSWVTAWFIAPHVCFLTRHTAAYVTCQDLRSIVDPSEQMVMVIKAPAETQLQVSDPAEVSWDHPVSAQPRLPRHPCASWCHSSPLSSGFPGILAKHSGPHRCLPLP